MVADPENPLVLNVLHASSTAYSFNPDLKIEDVSSMGYCHHFRVCNIEVQGKTKKYLFAIAQRTGSCSA